MANIINNVDKKTNEKLCRWFLFEFKIFLKIIIKSGNEIIAIFTGPESCKKMKVKGKYIIGIKKISFFKSKDFVKRYENKIKNIIAYM